MKDPHSTHLSSLCTDDDNDDEDEEDSDEEDDDDDQTAPVRSRPANGQALNNSNNEDLVVEDLDELNRLYIRRGEEDDDENGDQSYEKPMKKKKRKKGMKNGNMHGHRHTKLKHWEKMALEQSHQQSCNCRHHVMRLAADQVVYDWCRCKDHQHKEVFEKQRHETPPPEPPREATPPPPRPKPKPKPKPRKVHQKSVGVDATEPATTELALAYDPSAVDYDMIQEAIYYRTSSGRLVIHINIYIYSTRSHHFSLGVHRSSFRSNQKYLLH